MPLIECSCGMMMSVSTRVPRTRCIRCGGVEFRFVEKWEPADDFDKQLDKGSIPADRAQSSHESSSTDLTTAESNLAGAILKLV